MTSNRKLFFYIFFFLFFTNIIETGVNTPYKYKTVLHCTEELNLQMKTHLKQTSKNVFESPIKVAPTSCKSSVNRHPESC